MVMIPHLCISIVTGQCCAKVLRKTAAFYVLCVTVQINISLPEEAVDLVVVITRGSFR